MNRTKNFVKNFAWELFYYLFIVLLGLFAPKLIIEHFGSEVNGLSSSITQVLNVMILLQSGATTASIFSLYKPLANEDYDAISVELASIRRFYTRISLIFAGLAVGGAVIFTFFVKTEEIERLFIFFAFMLMSAKSFIDLFFISKNRALLTAAQCKFLLSIATMIEQIVYYGFVFLAIFTNLHFIFMYVGLFLGCVVKAVILEIVFRRRYSKKLVPVDKSRIHRIGGLKYAMFNEVSHGVISSSVIIIMSFLYGLTESSIYAVYALVASAIELFSNALYSAFGAGYGDLVARGDQEAIRKHFGIFHLCFLAFCTVLISCMVYLYVPFVRIYVQNSDGVNYENWYLAIFIGVSAMFSAFRIPYNITVSAYGLFKETWLQPVITGVISIAISVLLGYFLKPYDGFPFIIIGPIVFFLTNFLYQYFRLKKLIPYLYDYKFILVNVFLFLLIPAAFLLSYFFQIPGGIWHWILFAVIALFTSVIYVFIVAILFARTEAKNSFVFIRNKLRRKQ